MAKIGAELPKLSKK